MKNPFMTGLLFLFRQYQPLIHELVLRDLKIKYRRNYPGYIWSLL